MGTFAITSIDKNFLFVGETILVKEKEKGTVDRQPPVCRRNREENRETGGISRAGKAKKSWKINSLSVLGMPKLSK